MLSRTGFFLVKFFLLRISSELNDRVGDQSVTEGDSRVPDCPLNHVSSYMYNLLDVSVTSTSRALTLVKQYLLIPIQSTETFPLATCHVLAGTDCTAL